MVNCDESNTRVFCVVSLQDEIRFARFLNSIEYLLDFLRRLQNGCLSFVDFDDNTLEKEKQR